MKNKYKILNKTLITLAAGAFIMISAPKTFASDITPENVLFDINKERIYYGLQPLKFDPNLDLAAQEKSQDMLDRNYFEHYAFGLSPWDFIRNSGYNYLYAGENLAMNFSTSEGMVDAWMNSDSHRRNILDEDFEEAGIGVVKGTYASAGKPHETYMVSNMFGRKKPAIVEFFNNIIESVAGIFTR